MKSTREKLAALKAHFERDPNFAAEKAMRGEVLTADEYARGTAGIPQNAFERVDDDGYRLTEEALSVVAVAS